MTRILVLGDPVVTLTGEDLIADGALVVEDRTIVASGPREVIEQQGPFDRVVGGPGHIVLPGFVNGHFHSGGAAFPGMAQYIFERANVSVHGNRSAYEEEDLYNAHALSFINCIRGGQTGAVDFSYGRPGMDLFGNTAILQAYKDTGFRGALGIVTRDQNKYVHGHDEEFLAMLPAELAAEVRESPMGYAWPTDEVVAAYRKLVAEWDRVDGRIRVLLAPDWTPACSDELYVLMRQLADEYDTGIMTHVLETRSEMVFNLKAYGKTAMRRLLDLGVLGPDVSVDHFVWATDEDISILADTGAVAVNNPGSNLRLSTGICRTRDIIDRGGRIMFGTDSISFSEREDFFQELRLALYLQRIPTYLDIGRLDSLTVLRAACENGALALRMEDQLGSLAVGKEADLILVKRDRVYWPPGKYAAMPVLDVLLDRADATDIDSVMIAGRLVLDQGVITTMDEARVRSKVEDAISQRVLEPQSPQHARWGQLGREVEPYVFEFFRPWAELPVEPAYVLNARVPPQVA